MRYETEIQKTVLDINSKIDYDLDSSAKDQMQQHLRLKTLHAMKITREWVLESPEVKA